MTTITLPLSATSNVMEIVVTEVDQYSPFNTIKIKFRPNVSQVQIEKIIADFVKELGIEKNMVNLDSDLNTIVCTVDSANGEKTTQIINRLLEIKMIDSTDFLQIQSSLLDELKKIGKQTAKLSRPGAPLEIGQEKTLSDVAEDYIDEIIAKFEHDPTSAVQILRTCFCHPQLDENKLREMVRQLKGITPNTASLVVNSVIFLAKINNGEIKMESTYERFNLHVSPSLQAQQEIIANLCMRKLQEKFNTLNDEQQLYMVLGILMFKNVQSHLSPFTDTNSIIATALSEPETSEATKQAFSDPLFSIQMALEKMGISNYGCSCRLISSASDADKLGRSEMGVYEDSGKIYCKIKEKPDPLLVDEKSQTYKVISDVKAKGANAKFTPQEAQEVLQFAAKKGYIPRDRERYLSLAGTFDSQLLRRYLVRVDKNLQEMTSFFNSSTMFFSPATAAAAATTTAPVAPPPDNLMRDIQLIVKNQPKEFGAFARSITKGNYAQALRYACMSTNPQAIELIKILFTHKDKGKITFDINEQDKVFKQTPLHCAVLSGNQNAFTFLIQHGADPSLKNGEETSAIEATRNKFGDDFIRPFASLAHNTSSVTTTALQSMPTHT